MPVWSANTREHSLETGKKPKKLCFFLDFSWFIEHLTKLRAENDSNYHTRSGKYDKHIYNSIHISTAKCRSTKPLCMSGRDLPPTFSFFWLTIKMPLWVEWPTCPNWKSCCNIGEWPFAMDLSTHPFVAPRDRPLSVVDTCTMVEPSIIPFKEIAMDNTGKMDLNKLPLRHPAALLFLDSVP